MGRTSDARERLIEATIDLLWTESYGGASVDALCERAHVKKGSFYHFFKSKDDLVVAALDEHWSRRKPVLDEQFSSSLPPLDRLRRYFDGVYARQSELRNRFGRPPGCLYSKLGTEVPASSEIATKVKDILGIYTRYYESTLRDAAAEGLVIDDIPGRARALFAFMEGVLAQARILDDMNLIKDLGDSAFRFLGIFSGPYLTEQSTK